METVLGVSQRNALRQIDCWLDDEKRLALWIHSPDSGSNGWEIRVDPAELFHALVRVCVAPGSGAANPESKRR